MKNSSIFFVAALALMALAGCASSPSAPLNINTNVQTAVVTGTGSQPKACSMIYAPVCAIVHIQCFVAPCNPVKQTFSNRCVMENNPLAEFLHTGECLPTDTVTPTAPTPSAPTPNNSNTTRPTTTTPTNNTSANATGPSVGLANPASVYCEESGGTLVILEGTGGQYGMCRFADGKECEEWAFYRGECGK